MTDKIAINSAIKLLKQTGTNTWDYTTLKICYPSKCVWIVLLLASLDIPFNRHHLISVKLLQSYKKDLLRG